MYQFTRDFVINDNKGKLTSGRRFLWDSANEVLMIDHVANLRKQDVAKVYHYPYQEEVMDTLVADFEQAKLKAPAELQEGDVIRLVLTLGQEGREISTFNDQYPHHVRRYFYEAAYTEDGGMEKVADQIMKGIERDNALSDLRYFVADQEGAVITFSATDVYTRFVGARLVRVGKENACPCGEVVRQGEILTGFRDWDAFEIADRKGLLADYAGKEDAPGYKVFSLDKVGTEGNGNVAQIIKNLRVPTFEHMNWFGTMRDELPIPNGKYDQYLVEYVTERRHIGHQVMGPVDRTLVSFVFYVEKDCAQEAFDEAISKLVDEVIEVPTVELKAHKHEKLDPEADVLVDETAVEDKFVGEEFATPEFAPANPAAAAEGDDVNP